MPSLLPYLCRVCGVSSADTARSAVVSISLVGVVMTHTFQECEACKAKPGTPELCVGCRHNRFEILQANREINNLQDLLEGYKRLVK